MGRTTVDMEAFVGLMGMDGHPKQDEYLDATVALIEAFCTSSYAFAACDVEDKAVLLDLVHEEKHRGSWQRIFPHQDGFEHEEEFRTFDLDGNGPTRRDRFTWAFLRFRKLEENRHLWPESGRLTLSSIVP